MIKVKKAWRQAEADILAACQNLPKGVSLKKGGFGIDVLMGKFVVTKDMKVCPLGACLLGKKIKHNGSKVAWADFLGVPRDWFTSFYFAVDDDPIAYNFDSFGSNVQRAGYQAGRRVAKKVGLR